MIGVWRDAGLTIKPSDTLPELRKLIERNPGLFLVAEEDGAVAGTVIGAWDGRRAWTYHLAVLPALQSRGIGRMLMDELERRLHAIRRDQAEPAGGAGERGRVGRLPQARLRPRRAAVHD